MTEAEKQSLAEAAGVEAEKKEETKDPASKQPLFYDNKTLYIYCPAELADEFIKFANSEFYGKQYIALKELMRTWRETRHLAYMQADVYETKERLAAIEEVVMQSMIKKEEEKPKVIKTMGGGELESV
jgi:hypothetical protein